VGRTRGAKPYERRISGVREPKKVYLLACEGRHTERRYFDGVNDFKEDLSIADYIDIDIFVKENPDNSNPVKIFEDLKNQVDSKGVEAEEFCLIVDRDPHSFTETQFDKLLKCCKDEGYSIYLSNPNFEFWLLLHFLNEELSLEERKEFLADKGKLENALQYFLIKNEFSRAQNFNKRIKFEHYKDGLEKAIENGRYYEGDLEKLKENIGTNVYKLLEEMIKR